MNNKSLNPPHHSGCLDMFSLFLLIAVRVRMGTKMRFDLSEGVGGR